MSGRNHDYDDLDRILTETKDKLTEYGWTGTEQTAKTVFPGLDPHATPESETTYAYDLRGRMSQVAAAVTADYTSALHTE